MEIVHGSGAARAAGAGAHDHDHDHMHDHAHEHPAHGGSGRGYGPSVLGVLFAVAILARAVGGWTDADRVRLWSTLFVSICVQALPFLVLGVVVSGLLATFLSPELVQRVVPRRRMFAVPAAGLAGVALPGCECGSVPIAGRLVAAGMPPAAALTFLLAAPAINPVVVVATAIAFPNNREMVVARFLASFATAIAVGTWWSRREDGARLRDAVHPTPTVGSRLERFTDTAGRDLVHAGGYLVVGAFAAATMQLVVPRSTLAAVAGSEWQSVLLMGVLAVVLSICSEADAFVAAGLPQFSLSSRLVFLVVGPVIDLKLAAMQAGVFGRQFALRFAPVTFLTAVAMAVLVGWVLL